MKKELTPTTTKGLKYKVSCNPNDKDYYTDDEQDAKNKFQTYIADYGDGIRLYEAELPEDDTDEIQWEIIDSYDEDDFEDSPSPTTTKGELLQDDYRIILWEHNVYYRASKDSYWVHTVNNRIIIHDKSLIEELNEAENKKYSTSNERQKLLDSNREMLEALKELQKYFYAKYANSGESAYFDIEKIETIINKQ